MHNSTRPPTKWSIEKANQWVAEQPWRVGCNYIPSSAINQLEMWQAETFDPETIERELGWAEELGFNALRVYLHDLLWWQDAQGFKKRIEQFLETANRHKISILLVLFDDCWHDDPKLGEQPDPRPGVHNSGWVKSPGSKVIQNPGEWGRLEDYVSDILTTFGNDERVFMWDIYNEPGNFFLEFQSQSPLLSTLKTIAQLARHFVLPIPSKALLEDAFSWARAAQPAQPLTTGLWYMRENLHSKLNEIALELSDVVSFHSYFDVQITARLVQKLGESGRPLICTEYLARTAGCTFETLLPFFKQHKISCFNWGLVSGKTQTIYSWVDYLPSGEEPPLWFHDILRPDGTPYREQEQDLIRGLTRGD